MPFISYWSSLLKANVLIKQITVVARNWERGGEKRVKKTNSMHGISTN